MDKTKIKINKKRKHLEKNLTIKTPIFNAPTNLAGVEGFEPSRTVLETGMLPLTSYPYD